MLTIEKNEAMRNPVAYCRDKGIPVEELPVPLREGFARWYLFGIPAGSFLQATIEGRPFDAAVRADAGNLAKFGNICRSLAVHFPPDCIGSGATNWRRAGGYFGKRAADGET